MTLKFPVKPGRTAKPISISELEKKYIEAVKNHTDYDDCVCENSEEKLPSPYYIKSLTPIIQKDLSKVEFDTENVSVCGDNLGLHSIILPNNLTILMCEAGGDWEIPIGFIIYWDGKNLRSYLPKNGNTYNYLTKQALGNDEDMDMKFYKKYMWEFVNNLDNCEFFDLVKPDWDLILEDAQIRISVK